MKKRYLGSIEVSSIGMGCMGFTHGYGKAPSEDEAVKLIRQAFAMGCTLFDTSEGYGPYTNEMLVGKALEPFRDQAVIVSKFSPVTLPGQDCAEGKLSKRGLRQALTGTLSRLKTDYVDIWLQHRVPLDCPLEEIAGWVGEFIDEGLVRGWGLSQPTADQVLRAQAVTPLSVVESEYSMMERMFEKDVIPMCGKLGIGFLAFSPLASGFLSARYSSASHFEGDDVRRVITRFAPENITGNQPLIELIEAFSQRKSCTPAQISLAWMLHKNAFVVPIPGMRRVDRIVENLSAADVVLTHEEFCALDNALNSVQIFGNRTDEDIARLGTIRAQ